MQEAEKCIIVVKQEMEINSFSLKEKMSEKHRV